MKVYLAGFMSNEYLEETMGWRRKIREQYSMKGWPITWLDPYNGKEVNTIRDNGLKSDISPHAILHRDYLSVSQADIIVANLNTFGSTRTPTGTLCEIAWAWQMRKPIILITDDPQYINHPFTSYFASAIYPTVEAMLEDKAINYFYQGMHNAVYN